MQAFTTALTQEIIHNLSNDYKDNYDFYRFGSLKLTHKKPLLKERIKGYLANKKFIQINTDKINGTLLELDPYVSELDYLYQHLQGDDSKKLLIKLLAYRVLGAEKVKLPLSQPSYWEGVSNMNRLLNQQEFITVKFHNWRLYLVDLQPIGFPIKLYFTSLGCFIDFVLKQYEYRTTERLIKAAPGDIVIDAGGCWGDTALYFANEVGNEGKVVTFEFIPSNLSVMRKNISLNPHLEKIIEIIERPLGSEDGKIMYYWDNGPGSKVSLKEDESSEGNATTYTIDRLVQDKCLERVDFIKMDIEGAELMALEGAVKTLKKFKPKLAIAIYHSLYDLVKIPAFVLSLNLGYKLFIGHYTIHAEETILFASPE